MKSSSYLHAASFSEAEIRPLQVGRRLWVGPVGEAVPADLSLLPVWLGAGPAFGTGAHPSTQLCLRALERHLKPGARVLDLGTGSGILAIAAARLGAQSVHGVDIDPGALRVARANVIINEVGDRVQLEQGTLADVLGAREGDNGFTWVMANILAHVLVDFFEQGLPRALAPGGWLVLSGFLRSQTPQLRACLAAAELELLAQEAQDDWICLIARHPD
jgi:ribosomal protein L11 methyltransferase